jgi:aspartate carbamoyltransferase regulatory subunit
MQRRINVSRKTLRVSKIKNGTVIDHITGGHALDVIKILGITGRVDGIVTVAMNVPSRKLKVKDMVKIEGRELKSEEVDKIALLAPHATINIIRNYKVVEKQRVKLPNTIRGMVKCANPACISNSKEPVQPTFYVESEEPLRLRCHYCGYIMEKQDVLKQF